MSYEETRASAAEAGPTIAELERRQRRRDRLDALIIIGLAVLWVVGAVVSALGYAEAMP